MAKLQTKFLEEITNGIALNSSLANGEYSGLIDSVEIGTSVSAFQPLSLLVSSFQYTPANASDTTLMPARCLALESGSSGSIAALFFGKVRNDSWNWTPGEIFINVSSGSLVQGDPDTLFASTGSVFQVAGYAFSADIAFFNFLNTWYEVL